MPIPHEHLALPGGARPASPRLPVVLFSTLYPADPTARHEADNTLELVQEYLRGQFPFRLEMLIGSAHQSSLDHIQARLGDRVPCRLHRFDHGYAGCREGEITHGKAGLARLWEGAAFDYLLFMDSDMWTSLANLPRFMEMVRPDPARLFVKVHCALQDLVIVADASFAGFFHARAFIDRCPYSQVLLPPDGKLGGGEDCRLQWHLLAQGGQRVVPEDIVTRHYRRNGEYVLYDHGQCSVQRL